MLESARDPRFSAPWWTESSFNGSPRQNSSFPRVNCNQMSRLKDSDDRSSDLDLSLDGAKKKLTWISRQDHRSSSAGNLAGNDEPSIQNGFVHGRSGRFGGTDSPGRGVHNPTESPVRRGESVRRIRTPSISSMDFDLTEVSSSTTASRRLRSLNHAPRSASFKEGSADAASALAKSDQDVVLEASAIRRGLTSTVAARDQRTAPKPRVPRLIIDDYSRNIFPPMDSPESDRMVVSYLAEETERIINARVQKLKLRSPSNAADQLRITDHERSSAGEAKRRGNGSGRRHCSNSSYRHIEKTTAERVIKTYDDIHCDQVRVGDRELDDESNDSSSSSMRGFSVPLPISPLLPEQHNTLSAIGEGIAPPTRAISATMENYLENRRRGSNVGSQIVVHPRPGPPPINSSTESCHSNFAHLRKSADRSENPSTSSTVNGVRHDSFATSSPAALSPLNGNEDTTHSTTQWSQSNEELYSPGGLPGAGEDLRILRTRRTESNDSQKTPKDSTESGQQMQQQEEIGFPSRLQYWADFLGNDAEIDSSDSPLRYLAKQSEERISSSGRKELGTQIVPLRIQSNGGGGHSTHQERRPIGGSARHSAARSLLGQSQRYEPEVGRSLLSDKVQGVGSRDRHNASRRSQSCRRDSIINSLLDSSQENEARPPPPGRSKLSALLRGHDTSSASKGSRRWSVDMRVSSSKDTVPEPSASLSQSEKYKFLLKDSSDRQSSSRRFSTGGPEAGASPLSSSRRFSVAGPESGRNPLHTARRSSVAGHEAAGGNALSRSFRKSSVAGHESAGRKPSSISRRFSVAASPESDRSPVVSYSEPLQKPKSPILTQVDNANHQRIDNSSQNKTWGHRRDSPVQDSQLSEKKKNALQLERPKMSQKSSFSLDQQDIYKKLSMQTKKDNRSGQPITTSTSVSQACSMPSPKSVATPQPPPSPAASLQRWLANQFKVGFKGRSSSTGKVRDSQQEPKPRKKSPWRTRPAEILQGFTRRKGSSTRPPAAVPVFDPSYFQNLRRENSFDTDTSQSPMNAVDPWHHRMMHTESGSYSTPTHRNSYVLPSLSTLSPVPAHTKGLQGLFKNRQQD